MTDDLNTQTAAQTTEATAKPVVEATGAQVTETAADLESLLSKFDTETTKPAPAPEPKPEAVSPDVAKRLETLERERAEERFQSAIKPVIQNIRGDLPTDVLSDDEVLDLIDGRAKRDPRLQKAFLNRGSDPGTWKKIEKTLAQEMAKKFSKLPDPDATDDRAAVTAAVRGASHKAPAEAAPNYGAMTDAEFQKEKARHGL